jgi:hypothetical protein
MIRTLPKAYTPPVPVHGRTLRTCRGLLIGSALAPRMPDCSADAELVQAALLDRRTAAPRPLLQRIAGAAWRWC